MMPFSAKILAISTYLPERIVPNAEIESRVTPPNGPLANGILERVFGIKERRFATHGEQCSDLAAHAARPILDEFGSKNIDFLIFAAASSDLMEPATANIVQQKLGLDCPVLDVKNACNSFVSAVQIASSFVQCGMYQNVLITTGEKLSEVINFAPKNAEVFAKSIAGFSLGDAGAAALIGSTTGDGSGIFFQKFMSDGQFWELCTVRGGGSMGHRDPENYFFEGHTSELRKVILEKGSTFCRNCLSEAGWRPDEIRWIFTHQVSAQTLQTVSEIFEVPTDRCIDVFQFTGNTAAAAIPLAMHAALRDGRLQKGDKIALVGLAAGISISVQLIVW